MLHQVEAQERVEVDSQPSCQDCLKNIAISNSSPRELSEELFLVIEVVITSGWFILEIGSKYFCSIINMTKLASFS